MGSAGQRTIGDVRDSLVRERLRQYDAAAREYGYMEDQGTEPELSESRAQYDAALHWLVRCINAALK